MAELRVVRHLCRSLLSGLTVAFALFLSGCANQSRLENTPDIQVARQPVLGNEVDPAIAHNTTTLVDAESDCVKPVPDAPQPPVPGDLWQRLRQGLAWTDVDHPRVAREIRSLTRHQPSLEALLERASPYLKFILDEVARRGLPSELALLPAIESGFQPFAYSQDGALGLWQFMPATGKRFGLERDWWYEGRRDPIAATQAALSYLGYLYKRFDGNWLHALAAYNAGGATVGRAIRRNARQGDPTDFWNLELPGETDRYVPRLIALSRVISTPERYGLTLPALLDKPRLAVVDAGGQIDLRIAARLAEVSLESFIEFNAGYNRSATRPKGPHRLLVPAAAAERLQSALADLPESQRLRWTRHVISQGDTLGRIAQQYGIGTATLKRANQLSSTLITVGDDLLIPLTAALESPVISLRNEQNPVRYRVRSGDSLYVIARRFGVSINELRRWNGIAGRLIKPGQSLLVYVDRSLAGETGT